MAGWTASGLYAAPLGLVLGTPATTFSWDAATNKLFLTNNSDTPVYSQALASAIYGVTNEVSGTGWAAGGIAVSALATGSTSITPNFTVTSATPTLANWLAGNVSVATTTLSSAYGGYFYTTTAAANYKIIGIYFGGSGYSTTAGTFAVTWAGGTIATINCASTT